MELEGVWLLNEAREVVVSSEQQHHGGGGEGGGKTEAEAYDRAEALETDELGRLCGPPHAMEVRVDGFNTAHYDQLTAEMHRLAVFPSY